MKKTLRSSALIGALCILSWLPAAQPVQAATCEEMNNASCPALGATSPCWSQFGNQFLTCWCFNHNGNLIWSCPVPAGPASTLPGSCENQGALPAAGGFPAPYCGDLCETEGEGRGCRYVAPGGTFRTPCTCTNGVWTC